MHIFDITADMISTKEEREAWLAFLKEQADRGRAAEARLRANPLPDDAPYGQQMNRGHEFDQAMGRYEQAELAIRFLSGEELRLEEFDSLDVYCGGVIYETLLERAEAVVEGADVVKH